ncbi:histidine kinase [bacterium]|jgi:two-component system phosphate regulon sensor histidine kinase PhoR|nr:histidine kinase [bacterium]
MIIIALFALTIAVGFLLIRHLHHRRAVAALREALIARRALLRADLPGALGPGWDELCMTAGALVEEVNRLDQQHTGQIAQLEATLGSLQEAVLLIDSNNYVLLANQAFHAIFPKAGRILGERLELALHSDAFLRHVAAVRAERAQPRQEIEFVDAQGSTWLEVTGSAIGPFDRRKNPALLFVLHDITRQKRLENVRKEFVANVSHELRTPLSVIKGYVETLVDSHDSMPIADRDRFLKTIQRHTERLNSLLEDLLALSRLESANAGLTRERVDLNTLLAGALDDFRAGPAAEAHRISLSIDPAVPPIFADPLKLSQVFDNLVGNALKYTPRGSRIDVSARLISPELVEISVRDNGPGIPAEDLPHVFERFYRVDKGRSREKGGTGLGLSIVKHIVQLHGGRVWAESRYGEGATFLFTIPLQHPAASPKAPAGSASAVVGVS